MKESENLFEVVDILFKRYGTSLNNIKNIYQNVMFSFSELEKETRELEAVRKAIDINIKKFPDIMREVENEH